MILNFKGSARPTIGVEIELQILDSKTLDLTPKADQLIEASISKDLDRVKAEIHRSMVEIDSEISKDVKQCHDFLKERLKQLTSIADEQGLQLAIAGTHPFQRWVDRLITHGDRYQHLHQKYQWLVRRMNIYGLHVHIGMKSGEQALAASNALIRYLPHLIALSANSPFWQGVDTGMQSSRINIMESFPAAGGPMLFKSWKEFERYFATLQKAGVTRSLKDLYWHIRPNTEFGTIEFRICDAMSLQDTGAVVALIQSLVVFVSENLESGDWNWSQEQQWLAPENQWAAARDGLEGVIVDVAGKKQKISESILSLVEMLSPTAFELNCAEELAGIKQLMIRGNGAQRQRQIYKDTGSFEAVVLDSIEQLRLSTLEDLKTAAK